jgi:hypothetical protein
MSVWACRAPLRAQHPAATHIRATESKGAREYERVGCSTARCAAPNKVRGKAHSTHHPEQLYNGGHVYIFTTQIHPPWICISM